MLGGVEHLHGNVLQKFLIGRQVAALEVARVVDHHLGLAGLPPDGRESLADGLLGDQVELDGHALAALLGDGRFQARRVRHVSGGEHHEKAFPRELLRYRAADAPARRDGQVGVVHVVAMGQTGVAAVGLPLGSGADDHGNGSACRHVCDPPCWC